MKIRPVGVDGWTNGGSDRDDEANSPFSQYCKHAYKFVGRIITKGVNAEIWSSKNVVYIRHTLDSVQ